MSRFLMWGSSLLLAIFMVVAAPVHKAKAQPGVSVSFQMFYDQLSPYGQWIDDPDYGYVWSPRGVGRDFRPYYSGGNWAMTDYGNTWVSDYPWGWAPFHYGRWAYSPFYGWLWVPGTTWGPAWVHWRGGGSNYGWAPMGPGINININIGGGGYYPPNDWWTFVPCNRIYHRGGYGRYWRGAQYNNTYINNTTIINNTYVYNNNTYVTGPRRGEVERTTGQRVNVYNVRNDNNPGRSRIDGRSLNVYRPDVRQDRGGNARPQNVVRAERSNRDMNEMRRNGNSGNVNRAERGIQQNGQMPDVRRRDNRQPEQSVIQQRNAQVEQQRSSRNRDVAERQQRDMQMQQERSNRNRQVAERQQRDMQMQQERSNRNREVAERQQRDMQMQQERSNRNREMAERQQREAQMQQERSNRNRQMAMQQQRQNEAQQRVQQQRAAEQRAQQQQQIEARRQQRYQHSQPQQQQRSFERRGGGGNVQQMERSQPQQNHGMDRGGDNRGRRR